MTANTRQLLTAKTAGVSESSSDQAVMDAYLNPLTRAEYERDFSFVPEFFAVLATAEYHEHWAVRMDVIAAPTARVTNCPRSEVCGMVLPDLLRRYL